MARSQVFSPGDDIVFRPEGPGSEIYGRVRAVFFDGTLYVVDFFKEFYIFILPHAVEVVDVLAKGGV